MTAEVFESATADEGDDALGIRNTLSIEEDPHEATVRVDTNYKATRRSDYPVNLSLVDAVKAARALVEAAALAYDRGDDNPVLSWDLLSALSAVDSEVAGLRESLLFDLKPNPEEN